MVTRTRGRLALPEKPTADLRGRLSGYLNLPGDDQYEARRGVWNGLVDKHPAAIVQCLNEDDIVQALSFAQEQGLPLAVRGGGHHSAGFASIDDGLVIDLSLLQGVEVDATAKIAKAKPGTLAIQMYESTEPVGLVLPMGMEPTVGVGGLSLGGGEGWLTTKYGLTCDNLLAATVVTADGQVVRASLSENEDLLWALRGGSGNFGVVSSFEYSLHEVGELLACRLVFSGADAPAVLRRWRDLMDHAPDDLQSLVMMAKGPDPILIVGICWFGDPEDFDDAIASLREPEKPLSDMVQATRPSGIYPTIFGAGERPKLSNYVRTHYMRELVDDAIDIFVESGKRIIPSPTVAWLTYYRGAFARGPAGGSAYPHRNTPYQLGISTQWPLQDSAEPYIAWSKELWREMAPFASGLFYTNYSSDPASDPAQNAYGENFQRLREIKRKYDPDNLFRSNFNIPPAD